MGNFYDRLPKRVAEEIEILRNNYLDASFRDSTLKGLLMSEFRGYLRALEHMGVITREQKTGLLKSVK